MWPERPEKVRSRLRQPADGNRDVRERRDGGDKGLHLAFGPAFGRVEQRLVVLGRQMRAKQRDAGECESPLAQALQHPVGGAGFASRFVVYGHAFAVRGVPGDGGTDFAAVPG